jgi:ABC-type multidrug transport system fused ATPase/permease subunit
VLIDDTIENNICLEAENAVNKDLLSEAIKIAELEIFIKNFENGIHTIIGEDGVRVSGGEAQRINIARTIYSNRKFIFFDESLNNLDMITSKKILQNLRKLNNSKTIFFITHDLRLLSDFEEILLFNEGKLVENGSFSKLKDTYSLFVELLDNSE